MCEINVILLSGENRERIMDSVARILVEGDTIQLTGILGDKMTVEGSVKEINFSRGGSDYFIQITFYFFVLLIFTAFRRG